LGMGKERPGETGEEPSAHVFEEDPCDRSRQSDGDTEPVVEERNKPREETGVQGKIEDEEAQGAQAEEDAYATVCIHRNDHPVYASGIADEAGTQTREEIAAVLAGS